MGTRSPIAEDLRRVLGDEAYSALVSRFGGQRIRVPVADDRTELRARVLAELACDCGDLEHHSYRAVARRLGIATSTAYRYSCS